MELLSRKELLSKNAALAWDIHHIQLLHKPRPYEPGQQLWLETDDDEPSVITQEQAEAFNQEELEYYNAAVDYANETPPSEVEYYGQIIAQLSSNNLESFSGQIGQSISSLFGLMRWNELLVIPHFVSPYLLQENDYPPVMQAIQDLENMGLARDYDGGILLHPSEYERFFKNYFWIARCNADAPRISFSSAESSIVGGMCQHGQLHLYCYDAEQKQELIEAIKNSYFISVDKEECFEQFSETGAIEGRMIMV